MPCIDRQIASIAVSPSEEGRAGENDADLGGEEKEPPDDKSARRPCGDSECELCKWRVDRREIGVIDAAVFWATIIPGCRVGWCVAIWIDAGALRIAIVDIAPHVVGQGGRRHEHW